MKKSLILLSFVIIWCGELMGQYENIFDVLPKKYQKGIIIYPYSNKYIFVLKPLDYIKLLLKDLENTTKSRMDEFTLADELYFAHHRKSTVLKEGQFVFFPNDHILLRLFRKKRIIVLEKNENGTHLLVNYKLKNSNGITSVISKHDKDVIYQKSYKKCR